MGKKGKSTRLTKQKKTILACIRQFRPIHPTSQMIHEEVRKEMPNISLGTVYRNLSSLRKAGFVEEIPIHNKPSLFDSRVDAHLHFRCEYCDELFEIENPGIFSANQSRLKEEGFKPKRANILYFGVCKNCQSGEKKKKTIEIRCVACGKIKTKFFQKSSSCKVCNFQDECVYHTI